jgi:hypothetical protein
LYEHVPNYEWLPIYGCFNLQKNTVSSNKERGINYCYFNFNFMFKRQICYKEITVPYPTLSMDLPLWSHSLATKISVPNSVRFLFVGLDEERS